jgi:hypothetical protein
VTSTVRLLCARLACRLLRRHGGYCRGRADHIRPDGTVIR